MIRTGWAALWAAVALSACASAPEEAAQTAPAERRLERPAGGPTAPPPAPRVTDPGEAALLEGNPDAPPPADNEIVVPGQAPELELPEPPGDPRTPAQRAADIRAWDRCVLRVQRRFEEPSPGNPVQASPEELCSRSLGMAGRTAIPDRGRP